MSLSILYLGTLSGTSAQRIRALESLGHSVTAVRTGMPRSRLPGLVYRLGNVARRPPDLIGAGRAARRLAREKRFQVVWVDKGIAISPRLLRALRRALPNAWFVSFSPDDMMHPSWNSVPYLRSIRLYDLHVTTKSYNVAELRDRGARDVLFVDNAYDPNLHRPMEVMPTDRARLGGDVGFVGHYEMARGQDLLRLAKAGVPVCVRGPGWNRMHERHPALAIHDTFLDGADYAKAISCTRINLGFLRKEARDLQTTRSVEIPACGGFLLAERTEEHLRLFREGAEAEFFGDFNELLAKCRYYLAHEDERRRVAEAGRRRCVTSDYSYEARLRVVLEYLLETHSTTGGDPERSRRESAAFG